MIDRFEIVDSGTPRPHADRIIFCDGAGGGLFQNETDLELSHWRPNRTPAEYRAGTSTEICFRFLDRPQPGSWTIAVNNHVDVDGILSVYVLLHSQHATAHRKTISEAAAIGDFWGWGEPPAQRVFQGLTRLMKSGASETAIYEESFDRIPALIDGTDRETAEIEQSLTPLRRGVELVEQGQISRALSGSRLVHYTIPLTVAGDDDERAAHVPEFNELISEKAVLWPQARTRWDSERACLVSIERQGGWFHDLWLPGYLWADTQGLWQMPGLTYHDGMASYNLQNAKLIGAVEELQRRETALGQWGLGGTKLPFGSDLQSHFPLISRFLDHAGEPAVSQLQPAQVAEVLTTALS